MTFVFDWRPEDHAQMVNVLLRDLFRTGGWRVLKWTALLGMGVGIMTVAVGVLVGALTSAVQLVPWVILLALWIVFFWQMTGRLQARMVRRTDPNVAHPFTCTLAETGLQISMKTADLHLKWDGLAKIRETPDLFLFYYNSRSAYFLPKRAITAPHDVQSVRAWIRGHIPKHVTYLGGGGVPA